jgi:glycosyltransferase involved in cell wall biosynthesis
MRFLYHHRIASKDGQNTHIEEVIRALEALGHSGRIVAPEVYKTDTGEGGSAGWVGTLKRHLPPAVYELAEVFYMFVAFVRLFRAARREHPDFIYERYALYNLAGVWVSKILGIPLILEVNAPYSISRAKYHQLQLKGLARLVEQMTWRGASAVLPVSHEMAKIIQSAGVPIERIQVIPNAINPVDYENLPSVASMKKQLRLEGATVVGFTGYVREWDRLDRVITWIAKQPDLTDLHLLVVGDGPVRSELESLAKKLGVVNRLHFTGVVPRADVPRYAQAFDIALQTALVPYASPLCLFEYLALGKAIVAPDQPNHHEILTKDGDCVMYPPESERGIGESIRRLAESRLLRHELGESARETLRNREFTWAANASRIDLIARTLVGKSANP